MVNYLLFSYIFMFFSSHPPSSPPRLPMLYSHQSFSHASNTRHTFTVHLYICNTFAPHMCYIYISMYL